MAIIYRPGIKDDSGEIAKLINIASGGVVEYLFHDLVSGMSAVQVLAHNLENDNYPHSHRSAILAVDGNAVIGMALSYPSAYHKITEEMRGFFPGERIAHLEDFFSARVENTWYLDALCVDEGYRKRGIGEKLISLTKEKAIENGCLALSLIVFADNKLAIPVYERTGFEVVQKVDLRPNEFIRHDGGCLLMSCEITM